MNKYVVCYSGGQSSALVAIETVRKYGKENVILLNHNISSKVELADVKRFKQEIADYVGLPITYANMEGWEETPPIDVCKNLGGWKFGNSPILCTYELKTKPFYKWIKENVDNKAETTFLYGFDANEMHRINRRVGEMAKQDLLTDYPLARWKRTIMTTEEVGIKQPEQYAMFGHANCVGCLKAGRQHWYIVYVYYNDIFNHAMEVEKEIGFSLLKDVYLDELEPLFEKMKKAKVQPTEHIQSGTFWKMAKEELTNFELGQCKMFDNDMNMPCDCSF